MPESRWDHEIGRFLDLLALCDSLVPCTISAALAGVTLEEGFPLQLSDGALVRPAAETDFMPQIGKEAP